MKPNFTSIPSRSRPRLFLGCLVPLYDFALELRDLELLGLHLPLAGESMLGIVPERLHPTAQLRRMNAQVLRRLHIRHAPILDQAHSLKLELSCELPPLHDAPPIP